jgi:hypothetical protein
MIGIDIHTIGRHDRQNKTIESDLQLFKLVTMACLTLDSIVSINSFAKSKNIFEIDHLLCL